MEKHFTYGIWMFFVGVVLIGCATTTPISPTASQIPPTPVKTKTLVPSVVPTNTEVPSPTASITPTFTNVWTPSPIPQPTLTPFPTYSYWDSVQQIWLLLSNNGGCRLPCFWGITPGETTTAEFIQFMSQFPLVSEMMIGSKSDGIYHVYYKPPVNTDAPFFVFFYESGDVIQAIGLVNETADLSFPLPRLLQEYGRPDKVFVKHDQYYSLIVWYEEQRIAGEYPLYLKYNGDYLCYDPQVGSVGIVTWADGTYWLDHLNKLLPGEDTSESNLKSLDEVTVYDANSFYKQFADKNRPVCMKTLTINP
jgi:hypothetical protein